MARRPRPEELRLWGVVAATVRPFQGRAVPEPSVTEPEAAPKAEAKAVIPSQKRPRAPMPPKPPEGIEPKRLRRIARDEPSARLDLHGYDQDRARASLSAFLARAVAEGHRSVLVITGKGVQGDGVLRRRLPDWLAEAPVRGLVAGYAVAGRRHGGEGAFYVALKRKS